MQKHFQFALFIVFSTLVGLSAASLPVSCKGVLPACFVNAQCQFSLLYGAYWSVDHVLGVCPQQNFTSFELYNTIIVNNGAVFLGGDEDSVYEFYGAWVSNSSTYGHRLWFPSIIALAGNISGNSEIKLFIDEAPPARSKHLVTKSSQIIVDAGNFQVFWDEAMQSVSAKSARSASAENMDCRVMLSGEIIEQAGGTRLPASALTVTYELDESCPPNRHRDVDWLLVALCTLTVVLGLKMLFVALFTEGARLKARRPAAPEDSHLRDRAEGEVNPAEPLLVRDNDLYNRVDRGLSAHRNDLENILIFLFTAALVVWTAYESRFFNLWVHLAIFVIFGLARIGHTASYLLALQPWRSVFFYIGLFAWIAESLALLVQVWGPKLIGHAR
jgi:uncharacterized membrane protein YecN with MAPEG domain